MHYYGTSIHNQKSSPYKGIKIHWCAIQTQMNHVNIFPILSLEWHHQ